MVKELLLFEALNCGPCGYHGDGPLVVHVGVAKLAATLASNTPIRTLEQRPDASNKLMCGAQTCVSGNAKALSSIYSALPMWKRMMQTPPWPQKRRTVLD